MLYLKYLEEMMQEFKENRHSISYRTEAVLELQKGKLIDVGEDYLLNESLKTFDFF